MLILRIALPQVKSIGFRSTKIHTIFDGEMLFVPNAQLANARLINRRMMERRRVPLAVEVAYGHSVDELESVPGKWRRPQPALHSLWASKCSHTLQLRKAPSNVAAVGRSPSHNWQKPRTCPLQRRPLTLSPRPLVAGMFKRAAEGVPDVQFSYAHLTAVKSTGMQFNATFYVTGNDQKTFKDAQQAVLFGLLRQLDAAGMALARPSVLVATGSADAGVGSRASGLLRPGSELRAGGESFVSRHGRRRSSNDLERDV